MARQGGGGTRFPNPRLLSARDCYGSRQRRLARTDLADFQVQFTAQPIKFGFEHTLPGGLDSPDAFLEQSEGDIVLATAPSDKVRQC